MRNGGWEWLVLGLGGLRSWFEGIVAGGGRMNVTRGCEGVTM